MKLFINDNQISNNILSFSEEVSKDNSAQEVALGLSIIFDTSTSFSSEQESSDALLTFLPYFSNNSIQSIYIQDNDQKNVMFSTKYKKVSRIVISGYVSPSDNTEQITFSLGFEQD